MKNIALTLLLSILSLGCIEKAKNEASKQVSDEPVMDSKEQEKPIPKDESIQSSKKIDTTFILDKNRSIEEYKKNIISLHKLISNEVKIEPVFVESIIARSKKEFSVYYSFSYTHNKKELDLYDRSNELIVDMAQEDKGNCFIPYFGLAEFVDGEYAEGFFSDAYFIVENNTEKFCNIYDRLSSGSRESLRVIYDEFCKGEN